MSQRLCKLALFFSLLGFCYALAALTGQIAHSSERAAFAESIRNELQNEASAILKRNCTTAGCHTGDYPKANLNLEPERMPEGLIDVPSKMADSYKLVDTKNPENSFLVKKIRGDEGISGDRMPLFAKPLPDEEIAVIQLWIFSLHVLGTESETKKD